MANAPTRIDKYEIVRRLGHGGMGTVYLGRDPDLDRLVAIKVLRDPLFDEELLQRFFREGRASASLRHENVITVYDVGQHDHQPYMAMEYVDGQSLAEVIRTRQPLTLGEKLSYIEQVCAGLHFAHAQGIVHRDVKPANLMVDRYGVIRVLDFGIARIQGSGMTQDGALMGTLSYMSPEQMLGHPVDHRSDIFALGAVAYELLAYQQAFAGTIDDGLLQRLPHEDPPSLAQLCPGLPDGLEAIVMRALAKRPEDRFSGLDETRVAIREIRRLVDPDLQLEPIAGAKAPTAGSTTDRRDLLERRARQIALHRAAARTALARNDLESATAACEDARILDPDDAEASQLLQEIQQTKARRAEESKQRHERERTTRQRLADAELRLERGDVTGAAAALQQALALDPDNSAALTLVPRVKSAAQAAAIEIPALPLGIEATLLADRRAGPIAAPGAASPSRESHDVAAASATLARQPTSPVFKRPLIVASAIVGTAAAIAAFVWVPRTPSSSEPSASQASAPVAPPASSDAASAGRPVDTPPATTEATSETPATPSASVARSEAERALTLMTTAEDAAVNQKAATLARVAYEAAAQSKRLAQRAFGRSDYVQAEQHAASATEGFLRATRDAQAITEASARAASAAAEPAVGRSLVPAPAPAIASPPITPSVTANPPITPTPAAVPPPAPTVAASPPPASAPAPAATAILPSATAQEEAAIWATLGRYQSAYRERNINALKAVYPLIPREMSQQLERAFTRDCRDYDVAFSNPEVALSAKDPTRGTVTVRSTYTCQPKGSQAAQPQSMNEFFELRKIGSAWQIESAGVTNARRIQ